MQSACKIRQELVTKTLEIQTSTHANRYTYTHALVCVHVPTVSQGWKELDTTIRSFPQLQDGIKYTSVFSDGCLSRPVLNRFSNPPGNLFEYFRLFFSFIHTHAHLFISEGERSSL